MCGAALRRRGASRELLREKDESMKDDYPFDRDEAARLGAMPRWHIPNDSDALREVSRLSLSEILDRQIELQNVIALDDSDEAARAKVMLRATYVELQRRYQSAKADE